MCAGCLLPRLAPSTPGFEDGPDEAEAPDGAEVVGYCSERPAALSRSKMRSASRSCSGYDPILVQALSFGSSHLSAERSWGVSVFEPTVGGLAMEMRVRSTPVQTAVLSRSTSIDHVAWAQSVPLRLMAVAAAGVVVPLASEAGVPMSCQRMSSESSLSCSECDRGWMATSLSSKPPLIACRTVLLSRISAPGRVPERLKSRRVEGEGPIRPDRASPKFS
mmetsp:Transcript_55526/g.110293  ORF Transcript_55526/g.110293 Transcript_55526/m.110293 type:complete len:220 (+) Transcript_55526:597-1256(+)